VVGSNHRRSLRKLASSTRILCIYLDNKRLGHKCPCKSQGGALYRTVRSGAMHPMVRGGAVEGSGGWLPDSAPGGSRDGSGRSGAGVIAGGRKWVRNRGFAAHWRIMI
jgi:hypothetical protein